MQINYQYNQKVFNLRKFSIKNLLKYQLMTLFLQLILKFYFKYIFLFLNFRRIIFIQFHVYSEISFLLINNSIHFI